jgi:hypothetical protein
MSKYVCGRCHQGFDDLQVFGDHPCPGYNPVLAALCSVINLCEHPIDLSKIVHEAVEKQRVEAAVRKLEADLRRGDLSA